MNAPTHTPPPLAYQFRDQETIANNALHYIVSDRMLPLQFFRFVDDSVMLVDGRHDERWTYPDRESLIAALVLLKPDLARDFRTMLNDAVKPEGYRRTATKLEVIQQH